MIQAKKFHRVAGAVVLIIGIFSSLSSAAEDPPAWTPEQRAEALAQLSKYTFYSETDAELFAVRYGAGWASVLIDLVKDEKLPLKERTRAAFFLGKTRDQRAVPVLFDIVNGQIKANLTSEEMDFVSFSLWALGFTGSDEALSYLEAVATAEQMPWEKEKGISPQYSTRGNIPVSSAQCASKLRGKAVTGIARSYNPQAKVILERIATEGATESLRKLAASELPYFEKRMAAPYWLPSAKAPEPEFEFADDGTPMPMDPIP